MSSNPFLDRRFYIAWSELKPALIVPAIDEALGRAEAAIAALASMELSQATFESAFMGLENATEELGAAWGKVSHLQSVADSPELREAHNAVLPKISSFYARIPLNNALWLRLKAAAARPESQALTGVRRRFMDETVADFIQAGADLPEAARARLEAIEGELAQATQKYSENVLDATNAWQLLVEDPARLAGLPEHAKAAARRSAASKQLGSDERPVWRFTLHQPSMEPLMTYAEDHELRRSVWTASAAVGSQAPHDNTEVIDRILRLRAEKAKLLGKRHFADLVLERRMAKSGARALQFVEDFQNRAAPAFGRECRELEAFKARQIGSAPGSLAPWEILYWSEKLRIQSYAFDEELLRPYFPMDRVISGLFDLSSRIFGLEITARTGPDAQTWAPDVQLYDVKDSAGRHVGSFYADWHPRESKRGGAWMNYLTTGGPQPDGTRKPHLGLICGNLTPPAMGKPALLTHREVETVFHEFGHLLHHLMGDVEIKSLNGTNVAWDFVELPSQIMENWCWERESLDLFARHGETGAPIPEELFSKMTAARNFRAACATMRQVAFAKMDLLLHTQTEAFIGADVEPRAREAIAACLVPTEPKAPTIVKRFTHLFSSPVGYAAGYYSYKWAEVLDADAFTRFKAEGIFSRKVGLDFIDKILSRGNSQEPEVLFRAFMGREPDTKALLVRSGLAA